MNRRAFLAALIAGVTLDSERLLWVPGRKKIFIPPANSYAQTLVKLIEFWLPIGVKVTLINGEVAGWERESCPFVVVRPSNYGYSPVAAEPQAEPLAIPDAAYSRRNS